MEFIDLIKQRCSVRKYTDKNINEHDIQMILEAGRVAPTAVNRQPQHFLVIQSEEGLNRLGKACKHHNPKLAIIVCSDKDKAWLRKVDQKSMVDIDATIAADHMVLMAESLGLSSCWLTLFYPDILKKEFNIPENLEPVFVLSIGYAEEKSDKERHDTERNSLDSFVTYESF